MMEEITGQHNFERRLQSIAQAVILALMLGTGVAMIDLMKSSTRQEVRQDQTHADINAIKADLVQLRAQVTSASVAAANAATAAANAANAAAAAAAAASNAPRK